MYYNHKTWEDLDSLKQYEWMCRYDFFSELIVSFKIWG